MTKIWSVLPPNEFGNGEIYQIIEATNFNSLLWTCDIVTCAMWKLSSRYFQAHVCEECGFLKDI